MSTSKPTLTHPSVVKAKAQHGPQYKMCNGQQYEKSWYRETQVNVWLILFQLIDLKLIILFISYNTHFIKLK